MKASLHRAFCALFITALSPVVPLKAEDLPWNKVIRSPSVERSTYPETQSETRGEISSRPLAPIQSDGARSDDRYEESQERQAYSDEEDIYEPRRRKSNSRDFTRRPAQRPVQRRAPSRRTYTQRPLHEQPKYRSQPTYRADNYQSDRYRPRYDGYNNQQPAPVRPREATYSSGEILDAGHRFFGKVTKGLASVVEYAFARSGRPNGYILGQEGGGAFIAGLRYGEGTLFTKFSGTRPVYWQGPSIGYDFGAEGSKTLTLIYNLNYPEDIYDRYSGVDGSAYLVGGVGITYLQNGNVVAAPIRAGIGLRLGANLGYLKFTRRPTWNPF